MEIGPFFYASSIWLHENDPLASEEVFFVVVGLPLQNMTRRITLLAWGSYLSILYETSVKL